MKVLVTGSKGQLGSEIRNDSALHSNEVTFIFTDSSSLDICNYERVQSFIHDNEITAVINCAAYTAVDQAEENEELAKKVNTEGVQNLVKALEVVGGKLIHISTDYVFDGNHFLPYVESDAISPIGVYGNTKRGGEIAIEESDIDAVVIRTSWLYSTFGNNFVKTMMRLGRERDTLGVIFDQVGTPTYANDLAKVCLEILIGSQSKKMSDKGKIYHYSNEGVASWFDFACAIMELAEINCEVNPIETKDFITLAKRPCYSVLNKSKIKQDFDISIPYWRDSLANCISILNKK